MLFAQATAIAMAGCVAVALVAPSVSSEKHTIPATHVLHERGMPHWEQTWAKKQRLPSSVSLPMRIGLKQSNLQEGHERLMDISDPTSPAYGKHMTAEEVIEMFAPSKQSVKAVMDWVLLSGIDKSRISQSANKQWVQFDASVREVEDLLFAEYYIFEHAPTGTTNVACDEYHVPSDIRELIDYITPGIRLRPDPKKANDLRRRNTGRDIWSRKLKSMHTDLIQVSKTGLALPPLNSSNCHSLVTPQCIRTQYNIPEGTKAAPGNEIGVFESLNDHYSKADMDAYFATVYPKIPKGTYPIDKLIDGATGAAQKASEVGGESNLDFQAIYPLIWPQKAILFQTDDPYYQVNMTDINTPWLGGFNTFFDALDGSYCNSTAYGETGNCKQPECLDPIYPNPNPGGYKGELQCGVYKPTNVISISYGGGEADLPDYYVKRQCDEILKLGLQGVTVVASSGDYGVGSFPGDNGLATGCAGRNARVFYPDYLATCPYVLSVGSTQFNNVTDRSNKWIPGTPLPESATTRFPSGGGFSNYFPVADYQKDAVKGYFSKASLSFSGYTSMGKNFSDVGSGVYNSGGRGYPDVAALGDYFVVRINNNWALIGGTSLSAPIWASILNLVNEERIAAGKSTVGFVNPVLYSHPEAFKDITQGSNPACRSTGFPTAAGWDPVTGLGTPNYPKLLEVLTSI